MTTAEALHVATTFVWIGMVLAISFIEAPLKFRAPNVTLAIGLGIGRLVFAALNAVESLLAVTIAVALLNGDTPRLALWASIVAIGALVAQIVAVRPSLTRRSNDVLAGKEGPRSHAHVAYVGLELVKLAALVTAGVALLGR